MACTTLRTFCIHMKEISAMHILRDGVSRRLWNERRGRTFQANLSPLEPSPALDLSKDWKELTISWTVTISPCRLFATIQPYRHREISRNSWSTFRDFNILRQDRCLEINVLSCSPRESVTSTRKISILPISCSQPVSTLKPHFQ